MVGTPHQAQGHRDLWVKCGMEVLDELGLEANAVTANDPFVDRASAMFATNQLGANLNRNVRLYSDLDDGTAVVSSNCQRSTLGLSTPDGAVAHSARVGFGMERTALTLVRSHGLGPKSWPSDVGANTGWRK